MNELSYKTDPLILKDIDTYLERHYKKSMIRFITCGSVDDGKSTLIGRLLYDSKMIFEDHLLQLQADSKKIGTQGDDIDFALLVDGLVAEREQGITIDVAYRFFSTEKRKFIVADAPGHEQYTRNMVTGASNAELAVILVDARKGIQVQTSRHSFICHLLGIKKFVLAINKMDLVEYEASTFDSILSEFKELADRIGITEFTAIPISGFKGDNIVINSKNTPWYSGPTLMGFLESVEIENNPQNHQDFCMPVQWVNRPNLDFRGFSGMIASGSIKVGDCVKIFPSNKISHVKRIITYDGDLNFAITGQSVTLTLEDEIDCSRGQIITHEAAPLQIADQFEAKLIWMHEERLLSGRSYYLKIGSHTVSATVAEPKYKIDVNTMEHIATKTLDLNTIGVANVITDRTVAFLPYTDNHTLGSFVLIDKISNATIAAGLINFALRRSLNIHFKATDVDRDERAKLKNQKPLVLWMTGISGSGKSTIGNMLEKKLSLMNYHTILLDGDNMRHGLNKDLGFSDADRIENIRRVGEVTKLMTDAGLIVITAFISPFRSERKMVREMMVASEFVEIFIDTPLSVAEQRDVKGLYAKARSGQIKNFTAIDSPYENPENPEITISTIDHSCESAADKILDYVLNYLKD